MSDKNEMKYVPRNAKVVSFTRGCECRDATSTTGQVSVVTEPELGAYARGLQITVRMVDMVCDACGVPFVRSIDEWVKDSEEAATVGQRLIRGRITQDDPASVPRFRPDDHTVRFNPGGASVMVRALHSTELYDEDGGDGPRLHDGGE